MRFNLRPNEVNRETLCSAQFEETSGARCYHLLQDNHARVFGSVVRNSDIDGSDLDVLVDPLCLTRWRFIVR